MEVITAQIINFFFIEKKNCPFLGIPIIYRQVPGYEFLPQEPKKKIDELNV